MKLPRTQIYQIKETLKAAPVMNKDLIDYVLFSVKTTGAVVGRPFDIACVLYHLGLSHIDGKLVAEFGARGSLFASFISDSVERVYVSDDFKKWNSLKDKDHWISLWGATAKDPSRMICGTQDLHDLDFKSDTFDLITCFSVIEHTVNDSLCAQEIGRVLRPGGVAVISTEFGEEFDPNPVCRKYTEKHFIQRIVEPSGLKLDENRDLTWRGPLPGVDYCSAILFLTKES